MEHTFLIGDNEHTISIDRKGEHFVARIGDREHVLQNVSVVDGTICFTIESRTNRVFVSRDARGTQYHFDGRNYFIAAPASDETSSGGDHHGGDGTVEAPMPGSIVAVNVSVGDAVESGQSLVVLESMKMQNEISAPIAGEITAVNCKAGDQVGFGDTLVEIEAG